MRRPKKKVPSTCTVTLNRRTKSQPGLVGSSTGRKGRSEYFVNCPLLRYVVFKLCFFPSSQLTTISESDKIAAVEMLSRQCGQVSFRIINSWRVSTVPTSASNSGDNRPRTRRGYTLTPRPLRNQLSQFSLLSPPSSCKYSGCRNLAGDGRKSRI